MLEIKNILYEKDKILLDIKDIKSIIRTTYRTFDDKFMIVNFNDVNLLKNTLKNNNIENIKYNSNIYNVDEFCNVLIERVKEIKIHFDYLLSFAGYTSDKIVKNTVKYNNLDDIYSKIRDNNILKDFQKVSVIYYLNKIRNKNHKRILIGDDRGSGKTIQSLYISWLLNEYPILIICPAYLRTNWYGEIRKFFPELIDKTIIIDSGKKTEFFNNGKKYNIYIMSYELLSRKSKIIDKIINRKFKTLILDECHYIKNEKSKRSQNIEEIIKKLNPYVIGLTGTPIWNRPEDIYNIINVFYPKLFRNKSSFLNRYCYVSFEEKLFRGKRVFQMKINGYKNLDDLGYKLRALCMIRRNKSVILPQLPSKNRIKFLVQIDDKELQEIRREFQERIKLFKGNKLEFLMDLRRYTKELGIVKIPYVVKLIKDILEENNNEKIIVFFYHRDVGELLHKTLLEEDIDNVLYIGGLNDKKRDELKDKFINDTNCKVFLGSIRACGMGLNLINANNVIFIEYDFSPSSNLQAEDRTHRIGQEKNVNIYYITISNTIDEKMVTYILDKAEKHEEVLKDGGENLIEFNDEEFLKIFNNF